MLPNSFCYEISYRSFFLFHQIHSQSAGIMAFPGGMMGSRQEGMDPEHAQQMQMVKYVSTTRATSPVDAENHTRCKQQWSPVRSRLE